MLTTNLNVSDLSSICGVDKTDLIVCLKAISGMVGQVLADGGPLTVDLGELGQLAVDNGTVSFKPEQGSYNMTKSTGKLSVRRLFEMKDMKTNMNFYKMGSKPKDEGMSKNPSSSKLEMFRNVSQRLKTLSKSSSIRSIDSTA